MGVLRLLAVNNKGKRREVSGMFGCMKYQVEVVSKVNRWGGITVENTRYRMD